MIEVETIPDWAAGWPEAGSATIGWLQNDGILCPPPPPPIGQDEYRRAVQAHIDATAAERDAAKAEAETARYEAAAARLGVPDDKIDSFVKYAKVSDGETPYERMKNYLDSVGFKRQAAGVPFGGATTGQGVDAKTATLNAIRNAMK